MIENFPPDIWFFKLLKLPDTPSIVHISIFLQAFLLNGSLLFCMKMFDTIGFYFQTLLFSLYFSRIPELSIHFCSLTISQFFRLTIEGFFFPVIFQTQKSPFVSALYKFSVLSYCSRIMHFKNEVSLPGPKLCFLLPCDLHFAAASSLQSFLK